LNDSYGRRRMEEPWWHDVKPSIRKMAPIPTPTQNIDTSTTATVPPVPGQPIILVFVLLTFALGCSTYFLCRNVRLKKILVSLSAPAMRVSTVNALRVPTKLVAAVPSNTLSCTEDKGNTAMRFDPISNVKASMSASTSVLCDSELHCFKIGPADSQVSTRTGLGLA
jgi:hypothetical protein